jgi:predicted metalloprotease with PDZ domain
MDDPASHVFRVALRCDGLRAETLDFKLPVWMPGYYGIIDYAGKVQDFRAVDGSDRALEWEKVKPNLWRVRTGNVSPLTVSYGVKADVPFIVHPFLDENRAYVAPVGVFMHVAGRFRHPVTVAVKPYERWKDVATALDPVPGKAFTFDAPDFDVLYDSPILVGNLETFSFEVGGVKHVFAGWNLGDFDRKAFVSDLKRVVEASVAIIGEIPYKRYAFLAVGPGRGGIEHFSSQAISLEGLTGYGPEKRRGTLAFLAHEFFHLYNVKAIRPRELGPFDYDGPNRTHLLWMSEGFTVYYEYVILRRAGFLTADEFLESMSGPIASTERRPGRLVQSAAQSSFDSWNQGPFGGPPDKTVNYYDKGAALALLLDLEIRHASAGARSLDDVMRILYREFYKEKGRGFTDEELREVCERIAGKPLAEIFESAYTAKPVDYAKHLGRAGLELVSASEGKDKAPRLRLGRIADPMPEQERIFSGWVGR